MFLVKLFLTPAFLAVALLALSVVWMLRDQQDRTRAQLVIALVFNLFYGTALNLLMGGEGGLFPWKYDRILFGLDRALGLEAWTVAAHLQGFARIPLGICYELMVPMMIVWFFVSRSSRNAGSIVLAYIAEMVVGPLLYAIVPACGPIYAFGAQWLHPPAVAPVPVRLASLPNSFPSLHIGTAFLLLFYARGRFWRIAALVFAATTCLATLSTGEHYMVDLVPGLAFGVFAASTGKRKIPYAAGFLGLVLAWSLGVRWAYPLLIAHPMATRSFALATVALSLLALAAQWRADDAAVQDATASAAA